MLEYTFDVWLLPQLNECSILMSGHSIINKTKEISIIVILIFCLNFPISKCPLFALIYYQVSVSLL